MRIEITVDSKKWLRADLIDGMEKTNLYHIAVQPSTPILTQYQEAADYVKRYYPKHRNLTIVSDIGNACPWY